LLTLVNTNPAVHCLFMLVHSVLTNVKKILVNVEININKD